MKAKTTHPNHRRNTRNRDQDPLPHELGAHLFALIRRNLLARGRQPAPPSRQLTFAF
jgi:hypothetical protein